MDKAFVAATASSDHAKFNVHDTWLVKSAARAVPGEAVLAASFSVNAQIRFCKLHLALPWRVLSIQLEIQYKLLFKLSINGGTQAI